MKILLFIDEDKINEFLRKIKSKYYVSNKRFLDYFEKTFIKKMPFNDKQWNYSNYLNNDNDIIKYFFTNNASESINKTINGFFN